MKTKQECNLTIIQKWRELLRYVLYNYFEHLYHSQVLYGMVKEDFFSKLYNVNEALVASHSCTVDCLLNKMQVPIQ